MNTSQYGLPPEPQPGNAHVTVRGLRVPLMPVYEGREYRDGELMHVWALYVHPDWPEEAVEVGPVGQPACLTDLFVDVLPAKSSAILPMEERDGWLYVPRRRT